MTSRSFRRYLPWDHSRLDQQLEDLTAIQKDPKKYLNVKVSIF